MTHSGRLATVPNTESRQLDARSNNVCCPTCLASTTAGSNGRTADYRTCRYSSENRYASSAIPSTTTDRFIAIPDQVQ